MIRKILNGNNGLLRKQPEIFRNGKPVADHLHFNISHAGDYVVGGVG